MIGFYSLARAAVGTAMALSALPAWSQTAEEAPALSTRSGSPVRGADLKPDSKPVLTPSRGSGPAGPVPPAQFSPPPISEIETVSTVRELATDLKAILHTSMGDITVRLDSSRAPATVAQFVALARGERDFIDTRTGRRVRRPFYNGLVFHRVLKNILIQTGCPFGTGRGDLGETNRLKDEYRSDMRFDRPGLIAMAPMREKDSQLAKDSGGSQFFITAAAVPDWNNDRMTIFGEVESGMKVVQRISAVRAGPTERPIKRVYLNSIDIIENSKSPASEPPTSEAVKNESPQASN